MFQIVRQRRKADVKSSTFIHRRLPDALMQQKVGDSVEVNTPGAGRDYEIVEVVYV